MLFILVVSTTRTFYTPRILSSGGLLGFRGGLKNIKETISAEMVERFWKKVQRLGVRLDGWSNVPNSNVNDNGEPNLNNSNADNDNNARVAVRYERLFR